MSTSEPNTTADRPVPKAVVNAAIAGTVLIGIGAAVLSFTALADLAVRAGTPRRLSVVWPVIVDGVIVVATIAIVALRSADSRARSYAWLLLGFGAVISIIANGAHAVVAAAATTPQWMAVTVASVPPVVLLSITHMTVILARRARASQPATALHSQQPGGGHPPQPPEQPATSKDLDVELHGLLNHQPASQPSAATVEPPAISQPATYRSAASSVTADSKPTSEQSSQVWQPPASQSAISHPAEDRSEVDERTVISPASSHRLQLHAVPNITHPPVSHSLTTEADEDPIVAWLRAVLAAGGKPTAPAAVTAGVATSESTARRRIKALREASPELFQPAATVSEHTA